MDKLITIIEKELEFLFRQMEHLKFFINIETEWKLPFYLNPEVISSTDAMEIISGFFNSENAIQRIDHKEVFLAILSMLSVEFLM